MSSYLTYYTISCYTCKQVNSSLTEDSPLVARDMRPTSEGDTMKNMSTKEVKTSGKVKMLDGTEFSQEEYDNKTIGRNGTTFREFDARNERKLAGLVAAWSEELKKPRILALLNKAREILKRRIGEIDNELQKLSADDDVLAAIDAIGNHGKWEHAHDFVRDVHRWPFAVTVHHHDRVRERLEKRKGEYRDSLSRLTRLRKSDFGPAEKARLMDFDSPL